MAFLIDRKSDAHGEFAYNSPFFWMPCFFALCLALKRSRCVVSWRRVCRWNCRETERAGDRVFTLMDMLSMKIKRAEWPPRQGESGRAEWGMKRCPHRYSLLHHLIWQPGTKRHRFLSVKTGPQQKPKKWSKGGVENTFIKITCIHSFIIHNGISLW